MKKKASLVITSEELYQNYFLSGLINIFIDKYELSIICDHSIYQTILPFAKKNKLKCISYKKDFLLMANFIGLSLVKTKELSKLCRGFNLRLIRIHPSFLYLKSFGIIQFLRSFIKDYLYLLISRYCSNRNFKRLIPKVKQTELIKCILRLNPKYIFIPCQAVSYEVFYSSFAREKSIVKSLEICLVDNWDNLCSKSTFLIKPYKVGVYSQQAKNYCDRIQGLDEKSVFIWGSPRYDLYQSSNKKNVNLNKSKPYILYAGTSIYYDEFKDINFLNAELKNSDLKNLVINYLPHPYRTIPYKYKKKVIKEKFAEKNINLIKRSGIRNLNQVVEIVKNSEFIICGPTSIILEGILCEKKVIISARSNLKSYQPNPQILFGYEHFDGLEINPLIRIISEQSSLHSALNWAKKKPTLEEIKKSNTLLNYYIELNLKRKNILSKEAP